jgi:hypothetical protein
MKNIDIMSQEIDLSKIIKPGVELTISHDIISHSGGILFTKGEKVKIREVWKDDARWSNIYDMWIPEIIRGFKLEDHYGIWLLDCFEETINLN